MFSSTGSSPFSMRIFLLPFSFMTAANAVFMAVSCSWRVELVKVIFCMSTLGLSFPLLLRTAFVLSSFSSVFARSLVIFSGGRPAIRSVSRSS